jgi:AraC-like DNA-binding protein
MTPMPPLPLAFGHRQARVDHDPDALAQLIGRAVPLRDLAPRQARQSFVHRAFSVRAAQLVITAAAHSPLSGANHAQDKAVFTLPILGEKRFEIEGRRYLAQAGHNALLLPGHAYTLETSVCSGVVFSLCPKDLAAAAVTMAGPERELRGAPLDRPVEFLESHPPQGNLLALVRRSLGLIDLISSTSAQLPVHLGLDDKILRLIALLVYPQLLSPAPAEPQAFRRRDAASFADLITALAEDPFADWTLTRMERQAGLSRFLLRRHFQVNFGCGPLEWLSLQRLCRARLRLEADHQLPLAQLALECGYSDLAAFRSAFAARFHLPPESLRHCP